MKFKSKFLSRFKRNKNTEVSSMELFFNTSSVLSGAVGEALSGAVGEAQSMAKDIHSIATSDVECVTDDEAKAFKSMILDLDPSKLFHSNVDLSKLFHSNVESSATRDSEDTELDTAIQVINMIYKDSDVDNIATNDDDDYDYDDDGQDEEMSDGVQGEKNRDKAQEDEIRDEAQEDEAQEDEVRDTGVVQEFQSLAEEIMSSVLSGAAGEAQNLAEDTHSIVTLDLESVPGVQEEEKEEEEKEEMDHSTLAKQVKKLGKLERVVEKAGKQVMKYKAQLEKAEKEQKKTRDSIKAQAYAGVLSVPKEWDEYTVYEEQSPWQRFFTDPSGAFEQAMGMTNDDADLDHKEMRVSNNKELKESHSALAKEVKKLGKLEKLVEKTKEQLMKYEKEIEMAEEEQAKTRAVIDFSLSKLRRGLHGNATQKLDKVPSIGVDSLSDDGEEAACRLVDRADHNRNVKESQEG